MGHLRQGLPPSPPRGKDSRRSSFSSISTVVPSGVVAHLSSRRPVVLSSGLKSDFYVDCKQTLLHPDGMALTGTVLVDTWLRTSWVPGLSGLPWFSYGPLGPPPGSCEACPRGHPSAATARVPSGLVRCSWVRWFSWAPGVFLVFPSHV